MKRRATSGGLALALVLVGLQTVPSPAGAKAGFLLSREAVMINEELAILGTGLDALQEAYGVAIGGAPVSHKALISWTPSAIRFLVRTEPGRWDVTLKPKLPGPPVIRVGEVEVLKYRLPERSSNLIRGLVFVRLAPQANADDVAIEDDEFKRAVPDASSDNILARWYRVRVPSDQEEERIRSYAHKRQVELAEYATAGERGREPNDLCYWHPSCHGLGASQWNVQKARLTAAWEVRTQGVPIAVLDTGVWASHEEMVGMVTHNLDCTTGGVCIAGTIPCDSHGTAVASVAAARTNNSAGIAGAAWLATIGSFKVLGTPLLSGCQSTPDSVASGIYGAVNAGFRVLNISIWRHSYEQIIQNAVNYAWGLGAFVVGIAGNAGTSDQQFPGAHDNVFALASTNTADGRGSCSIGSSSYGSWVDLAAPGQDIVAATLDAYAVWCGTSFAAPLVAGAASLLMAQGFSNSDTSSRLLQYADPVDWDPTRTGEGRLNAYRALAPAQDCLRDVPIGAWVKRASSPAVYQVAGFGMLRGIPRAEVMTSWRAWSDIVTLCDQRFFEMFEFISWGYRPGTLVLHPDGTVYLITTAGTDRGLPEKRGISSGSIFECYGWQWSNLIRDPDGVAIGMHITGQPIASCTPGARIFPDGSIIRSPGGAIYVIENGEKRFIPTMQVYDTWFGPTEWAQANDWEISVFFTGPWWGFRPGRLVQPSGESGVYFITDRGIRAKGDRRLFPTWDALEERGYAGIAITGGVPWWVLDLHAEGVALKDANDMP